MAEVIVNKVGDVKIYGRGLLGGKGFGLVKINESHIPQAHKLRTRILTTDFYDRYFAKYEMVPTYQAAESAAAGFVLQYALETAGTTETEAVRQELLDMDIMTFFGAVNFDETGKNTAHAMAAGQILDGQFQIIWPEDAAVADFVYPDPTCGN